MSDWMLRLGQVFAPLVALIRRRALESTVLQVDATYIKMLSPRTVPDARLDILLEGSTADLKCQGGDTREGRRRQFDLSPAQAAWSVSFAA